jgi:hypothetical protein
LSKYDFSLLQLAKRLEGSVAKIGYWESLREDCLSRGQPLTTKIHHGMTFAKCKRTNQRTFMPTLVWVIVILLLLGALPVYPYSNSWGYYPSGGLGLVLLLLILVAIFRP